LAAPSDKKSLIDKVIEQMHSSDDIKPDVKQHEPPSLDLGNPSSR